MHSRFQKSKPAVASGASARFTEMPQLAAPRPVKALPEHSLSTDEHAVLDRPITLQIEKTVRAITALRRPDLHLRSLGYGIDE